MRRLSALLAAFALIAPAAVAFPFGNARDLVMRRLSLRVLQGRPSPLANAARRRAVTPPLTSACPRKVVLQSVGASYLAVSGDFLYFSDSFAGIVRVAKDGGLPTTITPTVGEEIGPIAVDETNIYFITADDAATGSLYSIPRSGGMPTQLATKLPAPIDLVIDSNSIYWINLGTAIGDSDVAADGSVERINKNGTGRQVLADKLSAPLGLVIDATDVYIAETGLALGSVSSGVRKVSQSGGAVTKIVDGETVIAISASGADVFYSTLGDAAASVFRIPKSGGTPQLLIDDVLAFTLGVFDSKLYAAVFDIFGGTPILSVPTSGGALRIVVDVNLDTGLFALDDCAIYYATNLRLERAPR